jgi:hypothetical protein
MTRQASVSNGAEGELMKKDAISSRACLIPDNGGVGGRVHQHWQKRGETVGQCEEAVQRDRRNRRVL